MSITDFLAIAALVISGIAAGAAVASYFLARDMQKTSKDIAKRQGVIDLHLAWSNIEEITPTNLKPVAVTRAANVLDLTASLWNNDVVEKTILWQSYWEPYSRFYDVLNNPNNTITMLDGTTRTGKSFLSREIQKAYADMQQYTLRTVQQTTI